MAFWWLGLMGAAVASPNVEAIHGLERASDCESFGARLDASIAQIASDRIASLVPQRWMESLEPLSVDASEGIPQTHSVALAQEEGLAEADRLATDGLHLYALAGGALQIASVAGGPLASVPLVGAPQGLFLDGDRVIVLTEAPSSWRTPVDTRVSVFDVSTPSEPQLVREVVASGRLRGASVDGERLVFVTSQPLQRRPLAGEAKVAVGESPERWLPMATEARYVAGEQRPKVSVHSGTCAGVVYDPEQLVEQVSGVHALDLGDVASTLQTAVVLGGADIVYIGHERVWLGRADPLDAYLTELDGFQLAGGPRWDVSGAVTGRLTGRLALSERDGVLRVALASTAGGADVLTVRSVDGALEALGALHVGHARDELKAARYDGDRLWLVTFLRADPLYDVDLSDPAAPALRGELEIPGWSDLLVPIAGDRLLAAGVDGSGSGTSLSLFDVADPARPTRADVLALGGVDSTARDGLDAWTWSPEEDLLALTTTGLRRQVKVIRVRAGDLEPLGPVDLPRALGLPVDTAFVGETLWIATERGLYAAAGAELGAQRQWAWADAGDGVSDAR